MNGFWWIVFANWTHMERLALRAQCEAWMAARVDR